MLFVRFKMPIVLQRKIDQSTLPVFAERSHHPPLHVIPCGYREGEFYCLFGLLFIAENHFKQSAIYLHQVSTTNKYLLASHQLKLSLPKRALLFVRFKMLICSQTSVPKRASFAVCISCCFTEEFKNKFHFFFPLIRITNFS